MIARDSDSNPGIRILYLTAESSKEPIIQSQVVNLLGRMAGYDEISRITLITFDDMQGGSEDPSHVSRKIKHILKKNRGDLRNIVVSVYHALANRREYDLLHVRSYLPMFAAVLAKVLYGKKVLFDPRGLFAEEQSYFERRRFVTFIFKRLERLFCAVSDAIVVVSEPFKEHLLARYALPPHRVTVIPTFSSPYEDRTRETGDVDLRKMLHWEDSTIFVYSGSLGQWQMIEEVITFFSHVRDRIANSRFLFLSAQTEELTKRLAGRLPVNAYAVYSVPSKELSAHLSQCDFGVLFRTDHIVNRVSAPIKVKDYLIAGLPIIISDRVGDSSEFVRQNGFGIVLSDLSRDEMTRAIETIVDAGGAWDRNAIRCVSRACFDIGPVSQEYRKVYSNLSPRV